MKWIQKGGRGGQNKQRQYNDSILWYDLTSSHVPGPPGNTTRASAPSTSSLFLSCRSLPLAITISCSCLFLFLFPPPPVPPPLVCPPTLHPSSTTTPPRSRRNTDDVPSNQSPPLFTNFSCITPTMHPPASSHPLFIASMHPELPAPFTQVCPLWARVRPSV